jgi:hypothetical protein
MIIGIPYHPAKRYSLNKLFNWIDKQKHEVILRVDVGEYGRKGALKEQFEFLRKLAVEKNEDLLIVECDTIPPVDAAEKLQSHNKDIVSALYKYRSEEAPAVAWPKESITEGLCEVEGVGTGCLFLSNRTLNSFSFYEWEQQDADWTMCENLRDKDFKIYLDTDIVCKHYADRKTYY